MEFTTTHELAQSHGLKILVYGTAGSGKTRLCTTTGDPDRTLFLSAEAGMLSTAQGPVMPAKAITKLGDLREVIIYLRTMLGMPVSKPAEVTREFDWVCIDSLSEIAEVLLSKEKSENTNGMRAYGEMADSMFKVIRNFRDLKGINVVFTAKADRVQDDGRLIWAPLLPGQQLSKNISYFFDEVFALRSQPDGDNVRRWLQTVNDGYYEAKDRSGKLAPSEPPNLARIAEKINSQGE